MLNKKGREDYGLPYMSQGGGDLKSRPTYGVSNNR
jgi:hypothetical protein